VLSFLFFDKKIPTFKLACLILKIITEANLPIQQGTIETFPNCKSYRKKGEGFSLHNGHRLPLQEGSFLLDEEFNPVSNNLYDLLEAIKWSREGNDTDHIESLLDEAYDWYKEQIWGWKNQKDLEDQIRAYEYMLAEGFTGRGETNNLLLEIGKMGRLLFDHTSRQLIDYIYTTATNLPGYSFFLISLSLRNLYFLPPLPR
jgi:hypothetical protein